MVRPRTAKVTTRRSAVTSRATCAASTSTESHDGVPFSATVTRRITEPVGARKPRGAIAIGTRALCSNRSVTLPSAM